MRISLYRYDPDADAAPRMENLELDIPGVGDLMVLDLLERLKAIDPSIAYRRSCREGVCGSDGVNMNGRNGLACTTPVSEVARRGKLTLRPLPGLPVIRDLVVDMTQFYRQYEKIKPFLQNEDPPPARERLQTPEDREKLNGLYECILCACCSTSCPSFWWNPEKFVGPAGLLQAYRFSGRQPRHRDRGALGRIGGPVQRVPLPGHHELRERLPEGPKSHAGDRQDPHDAGRARHLKARRADLLRRFGRLSSRARPHGRAAAFRGRLAPPEADRAPLPFCRFRGKAPRCLRVAVAGVRW